MSARTAAGRAFDRCAVLNLYPGFGGAEGAQPGSRPVLDAPDGRAGGGLVAEHDAQREPVAVLHDLELADAGVCGESRKLKRVALERAAARARLGSMVMTLGTS